MPIYEYRCAHCGQLNSLFTTSISAAENMAGDLHCSRCASPDLRRLLSRFRVGRAAPDQGQELYQFDKMTAGLDDNDPADLDHWAQSVADSPADD